eukprot:PhM_4_TR16147/c1_g1_i1/m.31756
MSSSVSHHVLPVFTRHALCSTAVILTLLFVSDVLHLVDHSGRSQKEVPTSRDYNFLCIMICLDLMLGVFVVALYRYTRLLHNCFTDKVRVILVIGLLCVNVSHTLLYTEISAMTLIGFSMSVSWIFLVHAASTNINNNVRYHHQSGALILTVLYVLLLVLNAYNTVVNTLPKNENKSYASKSVGVVEHETDRSRSLVMLVPVHLVNIVCVMSVFHLLCLASRIQRQSEAKQEFITVLISETSRRLCSREAEAASEYLTVIKMECEQMKKSDCCRVVDALDNMVETFLEYEPFLPQFLHFDVPVDANITTTSGVHDSLFASFASGADTNSACASAGPQTSLRRAGLDLESVSSGSSRADHKSPPLASISATRSSLLESISPTMSQQSTPTMPPKQRDSVVQLPSSFVTAARRSTILISAEAVDLRRRMTLGRVTYARHLLTASNGSSNDLSGTSSGSGLHDALIRFGGVVDTVHDLATSSGATIHSMTGDVMYLSWNTTRKVAQQEVRATQFLIKLKNSTGLVGAIRTGDGTFNYVGRRAVTPLARASWEHELNFMFRRYCVPLDINICDDTITSNVQHTTYMRMFAAFFEDETMKNGIHYVSELVEDMPQLQVDSEHSEWMYQLEMSRRDLATDTAKENVFNDVITAAAQLCIGGKVVQALEMLRRISKPRHENEENSSSNIDNSISNSNSNNENLVLSASEEFSSLPVVLWIVERAEMVLGGHIERFADVMPADESS